VSAFPVVEDFDVVKDAGAALIPRLIFMPVHMLGLQGMKEALGDRIVIAAFRTSHAE